MGNFIDFTVGQFITYGDRPSIIFARFNGIPPLDSYSDIEYADFTLGLLLCATLVWELAEL